MKPALTITCHDAELPDQENSLVFRHPNGHCSLFIARRWSYAKTLAEIEAFTARYAHLQ